MSVDSYEDSLCICKFRRGNDYVAWFTEKFKNLVYKIKTILSTNVHIADFTRDDMKNFNNVLPRVKNRLHRMTREYAIIVT